MIFHVLSIHSGIVCCIVIYDANYFSVSWHTVRCRYNSALHNTILQKYNRDWIRPYIRVNTHKRYLISRPNMRTMRCLLLGFFFENWPRYNSTALYLMNVTYIVVRQKYIFMAAAHDGYRTRSSSQWLMEECDHNAICQCYGLPPCLSSETWIL